MRRSGVGPARPANLPLVPGLTARDRAATIAILENAQWVYALSRYPKKQVLDDEIDVKMLRDRVAAMRKAAQDLSPAQRRKIDIPWGRLEEDPDETPEMLWTVAKKVTPKVLAELRPLVSDTPEAAFLISPETMKASARTKKKKPAGPKRKK
jgi:hypothetical protein